MIAELEPGRLGLDLTDPIHRDAWMQFVCLTTEAQLREAEARRMAEAAVEVDRARSWIASIEADLTVKIAEVRRLIEQYATLCRRTEFCLGLAEAAADKVLDLPGAARRWAGRPRGLCDDE